MSQFSLDLATDSKIGFEPETESQYDSESKNTHSTPTNGFEQEQNKTKSDSAASSAPRVPPTLQEAVIPKALSGHGIRR